MVYTYVSMCHCFVYSPHAIGTHTHARAHAHTHERARTHARARTRTRAHTHARARASSFRSFFYFIGFWHICQKSAGDGRAPVKPTVPPGSFFSTVVALCTFVFLCNCFSYSRWSFMWNFDEAFKFFLLFWWLRKWSLFTALLVNVKCLILGDVVPLCVSKQSSVVLLSDTHNHIDIVYFVFIWYYYIFRLSTSAIIT